MTHYLMKYKHFTTNEELNSTVALHKARHAEKMNATDFALLNIIHTYTLKYGAAHITHRTIEKRIGKSNATVRRSLRKLCKLHIIDRIHYVRPIMNGLGANIYVILPFNKQQQTLPVQLTMTLPESSVHFGEF